MIMGGDNVRFEHQSTHRKRHSGPRYEVGNGTVLFGFSQVSSYRKHDVWYLFVPKSRRPQSVVPTVVKGFKSASREALRTVKAAFMDDQTPLLDWA